MASRYKKSKIPKGYEVISEKIEELNKKMREAQSESRDHVRKVELMWPILRIHHQRSRYIYQMFLKKKIDRAVYDYCIDKKLADATLISKWKRNGYENLCCIKCIQTTTNFGGTCICRVPLKDREASGIIECQSCGCRGCSSDMLSERNEETKQEKKDEDENTSTTTTSQETTDNTSSDIAQHTD